MMRILISCFLLCLLSISARAQNSYAEAITMGDAALRKGQFKRAINLYFAAEAFDPSKKDVVKSKVNLAFDKIEALRVEAERAFEQVKVEQEKTSAALAKSNKLIDVFSFYGNRFALAYKDSLYFYIDKNGDHVKKLGYWQKAGHFGDNGLVEVTPYDADTIRTVSMATYKEEVEINRKPSHDYYMLDTFGRTFLFATDEKEKEKDIVVKDLRNKDLNSLPDSLFDKSDIKILWLNGNELDSLSPKIGLLKNLIYLDLSFNQLTNLPAEIGELENLEQLNLSGNFKIVIPKEIGNLKKLKKIDLRRTKFSSFPDEIVQLKNLRELELFYSDISIQDQAKVEQYLPECRIVGGLEADIMSFLLLELGNDYSSAFFYRKKALEADSLNYESWSNLSYLSLFVGEPTEAICAAQKTLEINPHAQSVETNLALGCLLNNQWQEAEKIFRKWKGQYFPDRKELSDKLFLKSISDLEAAGITHPDFEKVKKLFEK